MSNGASAAPTRRQSAGRSGRPRGRSTDCRLVSRILQDTKGLLTTHGSIRARGHVPDEDMPMVARLRAAGAIILAKTNVPEWVPEETAAIRSGARRATRLTPI